MLISKYLWTRDPRHIWWWTLIGEFPPTTDFWSGICTSHIPKNYGRSVDGNFTCLLGWHTMSGLDETDHLQNLNAVLTTLEESGLCWRRNKCNFLQDEVIEYLGHRVDVEGLHPLQKRFKKSWRLLLSEMSLRSHVGLLYYKLFPNLCNFVASTAWVLKARCSLDLVKRTGRSFQKNPKTCWTQQNC